MSAGSDRPSESAVFERLIDVPERERPGLLERLLPGDADGQRRLLQMARYFDVQTEALRDAAFDDAAPLSPGDTIDEYRIVRELHRGGMGIVYLAVDTTLGREVVLKTPSPRLAGRPDFQRRFENEARLAARCDSPSIARVYRFLRRGEIMLIAQEYVDGPSLRERLGPGPLTIGEALAAGQAVAAAMRAAHAAGIIHRDLKPENVVQSRATGAYKVLDFGIARDEASWAATSLTRAGERLVTPAYASPEQLLGGAVDRRSDIFAFGILLFELLTGRHPFGTSAAAGGAVGVVTGTPMTLIDAGLAPGALTAQLQAIIDQCLEKDPAGRYQDAGPLEDDIAATRTVVTPTTASTSPVPSPNAGWWWRFHLAAAVVVEAVMMLAVWRVREWWPSWRPAGQGPDVAQVLLFFGPLVAVSLAGVLRVNLLFTTAHHPWRLRHQYGRSRPWILVADGVLASLLVAGGILISGEHAGWATLLISVGVGIAASVVFIEPMTADEALALADRDVRGRRTGLRTTPPPG